MGGVKSKGLSKKPFFVVFTHLRLCEDLWRKKKLSGIQRKAALECTVVAHRNTKTTTWSHVRGEKTNVYIITKTLSLCPIRAAAAAMCRIKTRSDDENLFISKRNGCWGYLKTNVGVWGSIRAKTAFFYTALVTPCGSIRHYSVTFFLHKHLSLEWITQIC